MFGFKYRNQTVLLSLGVFIGLRVFLWRNKNNGGSLTLSNTRPGLMSLPYGETDDLRIGKSCIYHTPSPHGKNPWKCQECKQKFKCMPLKPRGRCPPFGRKEVDATPRVSTSYSPFTKKKSGTQVLHYDGHEEDYARQEIPTCSGTLSPPCFDLSRCSRYGALKIYPHDQSVETLLDFASQQNPQLIQKVDKAEDACLFIVGPDSYEKPHQLLNSMVWNNGQNHYIFESSKLFGSNPDSPFNTKINFEMAATSQYSMDDTYNREGYDTPLGLYPNWIRPSKYNSLDLHRKRRLLLSFKGSISSREQRNWQHQWIAAEYWYNEKDVYVDTKCNHFDYERKDPDAYEELLMNSTFVFCPGGEGINSHQFSEALQAGAIPVVTSDFLPPFHPDIDWSRCIVRVSEVRVVDVPNIVRSISEEEVHARQHNCAKLFETVFGKPPDPNHQFSFATKVWFIRIRNALRMKSEMSKLTITDTALF